MDREFPVHWKPQGKAEMHFQVIFTVTPFCQWEWPRLSAIATNRSWSPPGLWEWLVSGVFQTAGMGVVETVLNRWGACLVSINHPLHEITHFYTGPWEEELEWGQSGWVRTLLLGAGNKFTLMESLLLPRTLWNGFPIKFFSNSMRERGEGLLSHFID